MRKILSVLLSCALCLSIIPFVGFSAISTQAAVPESLKILCLGNSFALDTMEHVANIAKDLGVKELKLGTLYIGGCSINKHYNNAVNNTASYEYFVNTGDGWTSTYNHAILSTIQSEEWDWISIQHGSADGSRYADEASYTNLAALVQYVKAHASADTKIAFNMTWVGEPGSHEELVNVYKNDTLAYYNDIAVLTRDVVLPTAGIDRVSPTGTAVQNARTASVGLLTRDSYHLSLKAGRYIAGLTFFKALTGADISGIRWTPDNMTNYVRNVAVEAANNAIATPFAVTASTLEAPAFTWPDNITYGPAATPTNPHYDHAAKKGPGVSQKVDLLPYFNNADEHPPIVQSTMISPNALNIAIDLEKTPYLYYSFTVPDGADFTFSLYSSTSYSPWLTFLDASQGPCKLGDGSEAWDTAFNNNRAQYAKTSQSGCIDMRQYLTTSTLKWIITQMKFYASKNGDEVIVSYFFFGSEADAMQDGDTLLPSSASALSQVDGIVDITVNSDHSLTLARNADSAIAWPSVRRKTALPIDLSATPYLHLNMSTAGGYGNGFLEYTDESGTAYRRRLSELANGTTTDFTQDTDLYIDLATALGTTEVITLTGYTLSVYGAANAALTWHDISVAAEIPATFIDGDVNNDGTVNTADAAAIFRHVLGIVQLTDAEIRRADYNGDGNVSSSDVRKILTDIVNA